MSDRDFHRLFFDAGRWFQMPKALFSLDCSPIEILLLAYLINHHFKVEADLTDRGEPVPTWIYCTIGTIERDLKFNRFTQARTLKTLAERGYLRTKTMGMPPKRHYQINFELLLKKLAS